MNREQAFTTAFQNLSNGFIRNKGTVKVIPAITPQRFLTAGEVAYELSDKEQGNA